jgi:hypothetical protein
MDAFNTMDGSFQSFAPASSSYSAVQVVHDYATGLARVGVLCTASDVDLSSRETYRLQWQSKLSSFGSFCGRTGAQLNDFF